MAIPKKMTKLLNGLVYHLRPRSPRTKAIALTVIGLFLIYYLLTSLFSVSSCLNLIASSPS